MLVNCRLQTLDEPAIWTTRQRKFCRAGNVELAKWLPRQEPQFQLTHMTDRYG